MRAARDPRRGRPAARPRRRCAAARLPTPGGPCRRYACAGPSASAAAGGASPRAAQERSAKAFTDPRRPARLRADPVERDGCARGTARRARGRRRRPRVGSSAPSRSIRSVAPARRRADSAGSSEQQEGQVRQQARTALQVQLEHALDAEPARDALVGERRVEVAVADDVGAALERRADHLARRARPAPPRRARPRPTGSSPAVEDEPADALAELRAARLAREHDLAARPLRARARSSSACVDLPEPSSPSKVTNTAAPTIRRRAGDRDRGRGLHRLARRRRAASRAATRCTCSTTSPRAARERPAPARAARSSTSASP